MKSFLTLLFSVLIITSCAVSNENHYNGKDRYIASGAQRYGLEELSKQMAFIQKELKEKYGIEKVYISGGSARTVLDHIVYGEDLLMRDLDIAVVLGDRVTKEKAAEIGRLLESDLLGDFSDKDLRPRPRANPKLDGESMYKYNAGFGFFWKKESKITDLTIFHQESDLELNGVLNVDRILIPIEHNETLAEISGSFKNKDPPTLKSKKLIIDRLNGYLGWRAGRPFIVDSLGIKGSVENLGLRVVRTYGKMGLSSLSKADEKILKEAIEQSSADDYFQFTRNLMKLLEDKNKTTEVKILYEIGFFEKFLPDLHRNINDLGWAKFVGHWNEFENELLSSPHKTSLDPILALLNFSSLEERKKIGKDLFKIEGQELLDRFDIFLGKKFSEMKIGYFTGEFAPFHDGHLGVAKTALDQGKLDYVFIIPTPHATNSPRTPMFSKEEWLERINFSTLATRNSDSITVLPELHRFSTDGLKLGHIINKTVARVRDDMTPWTHIMGGDSFFRTKSRGLLKSDPRPRIVVERPGIDTSHFGRFENVQFLTPDQFKPVSATMVLHKVAAGIRPSEIDKSVYDSLIETPRYQDEVDKLKKSQQALMRNLSVQKKISKGDTFVVDLIENSDGLARSTLFSEGRYKELFEYLNGFGIPVVVHIKKRNQLDDNAFSAYEKLLSGYRNVSISDDIGHISNDKMISVMHSGIANYGLKNGALSDLIKQGKRIFIFETDDVPLSPLLEVPGINRFILGNKSKRGVDCQKTFKSLISKT